MYDSTLSVNNKLIKSELPQSYFTETKNAVANRNEYMMLDKAVSAEILQKKMAVGEYLPQVALGAVGYSVDMMKSTNSNALAFVSVSIPISDWWGGSHKIKENKIKVEKAKNRLEETAELLALQIEQTRNELEETYFQIANAEKSVEQALENKKVVNDNYKAGAASMSELLEATAIFQNATDNLTDANCTYKIKIAKYLQAINNYK